MNLWKKFIRRRLRKLCNCLTGILNFDKFTREEFEDFCKLLLSSMYPGKLKTVEGSGGDEGTDSFFGKIDDQDTVFQFKFFTNRITGSRWDQIRESLETTTKYRNPSKWLLLIPTEFTPDEHRIWQTLQEEYSKKNIVLDYWSIIDTSINAYQNMEILYSAFPQLFPSLEIADHLLNLLKKQPQILFKNVKSSYPTEDILFVGRNFEIMQLSDLLNRKKIVSIVGIGGNGKTNLAHIILHLAEKKFDIIIPIYLEKGISFNSFLKSIEKYLAPSHPKDQNNLQNILYEKLKLYPKVLLFLDNFEVLSQNDLEDSLKILSFLNKLPATCKLLLSSQNRRNLDGESIFNLKGLNPYDGAKLFLHAAKDRLTKNPTNELIAKIIELSETYSGHPLAIKILGKGYQGGGISEISQMMKNIDMSLRDEDELTERLQNLNSCFDYSYGHLDKKKRKLLLDLLLFKSPFTSDAVLNILEIRIKEFSSLVKRSWVERIDLSTFGFQSDNFYYFFHPLVRKYLEQKFTSQKRSLSRYYDRYRHYFVSLVRKYVETSDPMDIFHPGLAALVPQLDDFENAISLVREPGSRSRLFNTFGIILLNQLRSLDSRKYHERSLEIDLTLQNENWLADDYVNLASSYLPEKPELSLEYYKKQLAIIERIDKTRLNLSYSSLGMAYFALKDKTNCFKVWKLAFEMSRKKRKPYDLSIVCNQLASYYKILEPNPYKVLGFFMASLVYDQQRDPTRDTLHGIVNDYNNISVAYKGLDLLDYAIKYASLSWHLSMEHKYIHGIIESSKVLADLYKGLNEPNLSAFFDELGAKMRGNHSRDQSTINWLNL